METDSNTPGSDRNKSQWKKKPEAGHTPGYDTNRRGLETGGPNKSKPFNVLNQDGSLADLPDNEVPGVGALDGTVGLGT